LASPQPAASTLRGLELGAAAHRRAPHRTARPPQRRRRRPVENLARDLLVVARRVQRGVDVHLRAATAIMPTPTRRRARGPRRTTRPALARGLAEACDPRVIGRLVGADHPWRHPRHTGARSAAMTARRARSCRATAPPSSPDRAPRGRDHRADRSRSSRAGRWPACVRDSNALRTTHAIRRSAAPGTTAFAGLCCRARVAGPAFNSIRYRARRLVPPLVPAQGRSRANLSDLENSLSAQERVKGTEPSSLALGSISSVASQGR
jgi:hypothetical protein